MFTNNGAPTKGAVLKLRMRASIGRHSHRYDNVACRGAFVYLLQLYQNGQPDYKRIADFAKLSKADLGKLAGVSRASVRFDANIPDQVAERLREIGNIANLVAEFFEGNAVKVGLWFELQNPVLGNISPRQLIRIGRYKRLLNFVMDARDAEAAATAF